MHGKHRVDGGSRVLSDRPMAAELKGGRSCLVGTEWVCLGKSRESYGGEGVSGMTLQ